MIDSVKQMEGRALRARDGTIGKVKDLYFDDSHWHVRYLVVTTGSWLNERRVLIAPESLHPMDRMAQEFPVNLTMDQVRNSPGIESDRPVSRQREIELRGYYGWPPYWGAVYDAGGVAMPVIPPLPPPTAEPGQAAERPAGDPHLRSVNEVAGYGIEATDGMIGHVEDFLVDDTAWRIRYLVIDTRNWLPGRKVLVSPEWIRRVSWTEHRVHVDLSREAVKSSPAYEGSVDWNTEYAGRLHDYYRRPRYSDWDKDITAGAPKL